MNQEKETIDGFDIEKRPLTEEEATRDVTLERFDGFHNEVGEDFCDQVGHLFNAKIFGGFLLAKSPELSKDILKVLNENGDLLYLLHVYQDNSDNGDEIFYSLFADFLNHTEAAKKRANQILIQVAEHYKN